MSCPNQCIIDVRAVLHRIEDEMRAESGYPPAVADAQVSTIPPVDPPLGYDVQVTGCVHGRSLYVWPSRALIAEWSGLGIR